MKKLIYGITASVIIAASTLAPKPALALPTCEQEVSIRCRGYDVQGRPRLDIYYDSYEECVTTEQPSRCGTEYDPYAALDLPPALLPLRQEKGVLA